MKTGAVSEGFRKPFLEAVHRQRPHRRERDAGRRVAAASSRSWARSILAAPSESPSHRRVFVCRVPAKAAEEAGCAKTISRRWRAGPIAGRSPTTDVRVLLDFYERRPRRQLASTRASSWRCSASS